ncbi:hypothetical protein [Actinomadura sp. 3N407]|uniref:hypothetical protein n=1 Tax=Actinomadura sp. 3N407 TaxID=3457423 RepID=UPI003FCC5084
MDTSTMDDLADDASQVVELLDRIDKRCDASEPVLQCRSAAARLLLKLIADHDQGQGVVFDDAPRGRWAHKPTGKVFNAATFQELDRHKLVDTGNGFADPVKMKWAGAKVLGLMPWTTLVCVSTESAAAVVAEIGDAGSESNTVDHDDTRVIIYYTDKRYPLDLASWAVENGHATDAHAGAVIADL